MKLKLKINQWDRKAHLIADDEEKALLTCNKKEYSDMTFGIFNVIKKIDEVSNNTTAYPDISLLTREEPFMVSLVNGLNLEINIKECANYNLITQDFLEGIFNSENIEEDGSKLFVFIISLIEKVKEEIETVKDNSKTVIFHAELDI